MGLKEIIIKGEIKHVEGRGPTESRITISAQEREQSCFTKDHLILCGKEPKPGMRVRIINLPFFRPRVIGKG